MGMEISLGRRRSSRRFHRFLPMHILVRPGLRQGRRFEARRHTTVMLSCDDMSGCLDITDFGSLNEEALAQRSNLAVVGHIGPAPRGDRMSLPHALSTLAALGQPMRLEIFRLLMRKEPDGLPAGTIADAIGCPHNTLSTHLSILARAGLVRGTRDGRSIVYRANVDGMRNLIAFLVTDCCDGHPELCHLEDALRTNACCAPAPKASARRKK